MTVLDPGHAYQLAVLDEHKVEWEVGPNLLIFVKREGPGYPGNVGHHPGTTIQEVLRATIDRVKYLQDQIPCSENELVLASLRIAIRALEVRAASRHNRLIPNLAGSIESFPTCKKCLHVGCEGECCS